LLVRILICVCIVGGGQRNGVRVCVRACVRACVCVCMCVGGNTQVNNQAQEGSRLRQPTWHLLCHHVGHTNNVGGGSCAQHRSYCQWVHMLEISNHFDCRWFQPLVTFQRREFIKQPLERRCGVAEENVATGLRVMVAPVSNRRTRDGQSAGGAGAVRARVRVVHQSHIVKLN
jgi:hypothetical protein